MIDEEVGKIFYAIGEIRAEITVLMQATREISQKLDTFSVKKIGVDWYLVANTPEGTRKVKIT